MFMKKAIIFGTGLVYELIHKEVAKTYSIVLLIDNNPDKIGKQLNGVLIASPESISNYDYDVIVLTSSHIVPMAKQVMKLGVEASSLIIGANFALNNLSDNANIHYYLSEDLEIKCEYACKDETTVFVDLFHRKFAIGVNNIPTILALINSNSLKNFMQLADKYCGGKRGVFLDVGANIGTTSIESINYENVTECIAFEPEPNNYNLLMANIYLNNLGDQIQALRYAVGDHEENCELVVSPICSGDNRLRKTDTSNTSSSVNEERKKVEVVNVVTLDNVLTKKAEDIAFVWIDVQGFEYFVLNGGKDILSQRNVAVQIEYWPLGLAETDTMFKLNAFLVDQFKEFIDMNKFEQGEETPEPIENVYQLEKRLSLLGPAAHTDLFLIK